MSLKHVKISLTWKIFSKKHFFFTKSDATEKIVLRYIVPTIVYEKHLIFNLKYKMGTWKQVQLNHIFILTERYKNFKQLLEQSKNHFCHQL